MPKYSIFWKTLSVFKRVQKTVNEKWKKIAPLSKWVINLSTWALPLEAWTEGLQELQQLWEVSKLIQ